MAPKDPLLVRQTLQGRPDAFGILVERYSGLVCALILEHVRRPDEVEDLVQETFCAAYQALPGLRRPSRFAPWLAQIARHTALRWVRQEQARTRVESASQEWQPTPLAAPDEEVERREQVGLLWAALDRLPEDLRRLVVLHHLEDCSLREVARFLGQAMATVHWRLLRAERQLGRQVVHGLDAQLPSRPLDRKRLAKQVLASLSLGLPLAPRSDALLLPWWSGQRLLNLFTTASPAVVVVGTLLGAGALYLAGSPYLGHAGKSEGTGRSSPDAPGFRIELVRADSSVAAPVSAVPDSLAPVSSGSRPADSPVESTGSAQSPAGLGPEQSVQPSARDLVQQLRYSGTAASTAILEQIARQNLLSGAENHPHPLDWLDTVEVQQQEQAEVVTPLTAAWIGLYLGRGKVFLKNENLWLESTRISVNITPGHRDRLWIVCCAAGNTAGSALPQGGPKGVGFQVEVQDSTTLAGEVLDPGGQVKFKYSFSKSTTPDKEGVAGWVKVYHKTPQGPNSSFHLVGEWEFTAQKLPGKGQAVDPPQAASRATNR